MTMCRLREYAKNQANNPEVKEKQGELVEARNKIEEQMERFKAWEKELKTKAFSNEGLATAKVFTHQQKQVDKKEEEKSKANSWLKDILQQLSDARDEFESERERLSRPKKHQGKGKAASIELIIHKLEDNAIQSKRVELMLRSLENEAVTYEQIEKIQEAFESYLQNPDSSEARKMWDEMYKNLEDNMIPVAPTIAELLSSVPPAKKEEKIQEGSKAIVSVNALDNGQPNQILPPQSQPQNKPGNTTSAQKDWANTASVWETTKADKFNPEEKKEIKKSELIQTNGKFNLLLNCSSGKISKYVNASWNTATKFCSTSRVPWTTHYWNRQSKSI